MKWILRSDIPPIWSQKDEMDMDITYEWTVQIQIYPPASAMKSTWTSDNNLYVQMKCSYSDILLISAMKSTRTSDNNLYVQMKWSYSDIPLLSDEVHMGMRNQFIFCNCHHFATDHLHDYIQFTIYHLEVHFQCCDAQEISAISPKTCTLKLQLLHNSKRPTK